MRPRGVEARLRADFTRLAARHAILASSVMSYGHGNDRIQIAAACDAQYVMALAVMLASVGANLGNDRRAVAHVLESGLSDSAKARVLRSIPPERIAIRWVSIPSNRLHRLRETLRSFDTVSVASYYRLLLTETVPADLDRLIYLDCDLVVLHDLWDLWTADIGTTCLGAVPELLQSARYASGRAGIRLHRELGLRPGLELFNSGVMLINLARWREAAIASRAVTYLREAADYLRWHDQEALNAVVAGDWTPLDPRWNVTMHVFRRPQDEERRTLAKTPRIVHYNSATKPWDAAFRFGHRDLFYRYLDETDWSGWRPSTAGNSLRRRWPARLVRVSRKARHAVGRRVMLARKSLQGRSMLYRRPRQIAGTTITDSGRSEIRVLMSATTGDRLPERQLRDYLARGADRVLLVVARLDDDGLAATRSLDGRLHVFERPEEPEARHNVLRQLLHRYGSGHWCVVVNDDERFLGPSSNESLTGLRDELERGGYEALDCLVEVPDGSGDGPRRLRRLPMTASDPLRRRVFTIPVHAATPERRVAELACRSRVAMFRFRADMYIDREFRGIEGARLAPVTGVLAPATAAGTSMLREELVSRDS